MKTYPTFLWLGFVGPAFPCHTALNCKTGFLAPWAALELGHHA